MAIPFQLSNFHGIKCKQDTVSALPAPCSPYIIISTEMWLTPDHQNSKLDFSECHAIYSNDRITLRSGRVILATDNTLLPRTHYQEA